MVGGTSLTLRTKHCGIAIRPLFFGFQRKGNACIVQPLDDPSGLASNSALR
jgi:hypothetical protein